MRHAQVEDSSDDDEAPSGGGGSCRGGGKNKRVLANRQSAQRSRMRKIEFVGKLDKEAAELRAEISQLEPGRLMLCQRNAGKSQFPRARPCRNIRTACALMSGTGETA